jgi:1-acyl-sn-glycerol-3-phosphate acyltransferase
MAKMTDEELAVAVETNKKIYHEHFDIEYSKALVDHALHIPMDIYFRTKKIGFEKKKMERNNPDHPVIVISNHSGMAFPWDGVVYLGYTLREKNYEVDEVPRPLVAPILSKTKLMNPFMIHHLWKRCSGVDATFLNFETMMHYPLTNVMIFPEGVAGIGKGFNNKYQLQRFATSFVRMSLKYKTDVVPFVTINGEYLNPYTYSYKCINKIVNKIGLPFMPMGIHTPLLLFLPWMFYFTMPAQLNFVKCRRIRPSDFVDKPYEKLEQSDIEMVRDKIAISMQEDMDKYVVEYGKKAYQWKDLYNKVCANMKYFPFMFPIAWPLLFTEFERQWIRYKKTGQEIKMNFGFFAPLLFLMRNPITFFYYVPIIGWIPLLLKGYSKYKK